MLSSVHNVKVIVIEKKENLVFLRVFCLNQKNKKLSLHIF